MNEITIFEPSWTCDISYLEDFETPDPLDDPELELAWDCYCSCCHDE